MVLDSDVEDTNVYVCQDTTTPGGMMDPSKDRRLNRLQEPSMTVDLTALKLKVSIRTTSWCCITLPVWSTTNNKLVCIFTYLIFLFEKPNMIQIYHL